MTGRVRDMIVGPERDRKLGEVIAEGAYYGMQTFDQALLHLYRDGKISMEEALKAATHPHDFKLLVASEGQRSTSVDQIYAPDAGRKRPAAAGRRRLGHGTREPVSARRAAPGLRAFTSLCEALVSSARGRGGRARRDRVELRM